MMVYGLEQKEEEIEVVEYSEKKKRDGIEMCYKR